MNTNEFVDLLLDNGDIVRIECPPQHFDQCMETIEFTMKRKEWWCAGQFDGCNVKLNGVFIERVNMGRVVAML